MSSRRADGETHDAVPGPVVVVVADAPPPAAAAGLASRLFFEDARMFATQLPCVSSTPFGSPVVPLV